MLTEGDTHDPKDPADHVVHPRHGGHHGTGDREVLQNPCGGRERRVRPHARVLTLLRSLGESVPAIVWGRRGDVLAWNRTGHALFAEHLDFAAPDEPSRRPSNARLFFLDPHTREQYRNREELARAHVAYLRLASGRYPTDGRLAELIGEDADLEAAHQPEAVLEPHLGRRVEPEQIFEEGPERALAEVERQIREAIVAKRLSAADRTPRSEEAVRRTLRSAGGR
jgi:hypothetical protein